MDSAVEDLPEPSSARPSSARPHSPSNIQPLEAATKVEAKKAGDSPSSAAALQKTPKKVIGSSLDSAVDDLPVPMSARSRPSSRPSSAETAMRKQEAMRA